MTFAELQWLLHDFRYNLVLYIFIILHIIFCRELSIIYVLCSITHIEGVPFEISHVTISQTTACLKYVTNRTYPVSGRSSHVDHKSSPGRRTFKISRWSLIRN